jgi:hypothetical protein
VLAVALLVGLPITPGGHIASVVGQSILEEGAWIQALLVIPGMSFLALGTFHLFFTEEKPWNSGETLIRVMYSMGLALPVLVCIGLGFWMRTTISVSGVVVSAVVVGLGVGEFYGLRKISGVRRFERWKSLILRLNLRWFYTLLWNIIRQSLAIARSIGELFEGEGAMLWMFAFVALLFLALR